VGDCLTILQESYGPYQIIKYEKKPGFEVAQCKCRPCVIKLMKAIDDDRVHWIFNTRRRREGFDQVRSMPVSPDETRNYVPFNPSIDLPTMDGAGNQGPNQPISFGALLWHELIGHGSEGAGHPDPRSNPWNRIPDISPQVDPTIAIENEYRECVGEPLRWRHYYY